jgi:hypothetical protein
MVFNVYVILCCILFPLCMFLAWKLYTFAILLIDLEDAIEESLDILDERYKNINKILQKPVFFDSMEVRQVIEEIRLSHVAVLEIAKLLTKDIGQEGEKRIEKNKESTDQE